MSKDWYYAVEGTSHGPVSEIEFEQLVTGGTIRSDTLVWQEGMEDWLPYARAKGSDNAAPLPPRTPYAGEGKNPAREDANTFVGALKDAFARYVDFKTRSTRAQYWWFSLWSFLISFALGIVDAAMGMGETGLLSTIASLVLFLPSISVAIRRLHDIGRTGWWLLLIFIPILGWIVLLVFYCTKSEDYANQWGPAPYH